MKTLLNNHLEIIRGGFDPLTTPEGIRQTDADWTLQLILDQLARQQQQDELKFLLQGMAD